MNPVYFFIILERKTLCLNGAFNNFNNSVFTLEISQICFNFLSVITNIERVILCDVHNVNV